ncbi:DUF1566 domain-containing protein [bacterium]|nr:DUF1566 domain-containing protein [bacterium]
MKKLSLIISLCLTFAVLSSCARKDLSDDARNSWQQAEAEQSCDQIGEYRCKGLISQQCSESGIWHTYEKCPFACNETTGKCYDPNDPTDPDRPLDTPAEVCRSIYDCYRQCLDDECVHACIELGTETPEGLNLFTAMLSCAANNCGGMTTAEDMNDCFLSYCKKEIEECNLAGSSDLIDPADLTDPTDSTDPTDPSACRLDESILDCSSSDYCFAFKGEGVINALDQITDISFTTNTAETLAGFESSGRHLKHATSMFFSRIFNDNQVIELILDADPDPAKGNNYTTLVVAQITTSYIDAMKETGSNRLAIAPFSYVYDLDFSVDGQYAKQCIIAASTMSYVHEFGQALPDGVTQVCYTETDLFGVGDTFRLAMRSELVTDVQEIVDMYQEIMYQEINSPEDLCHCYELSSNSEVDCSTINFEELTDNHCDKNPCEGLPNSTGGCINESNGYSCECKTGATWSGSAEYGFECYVDPSNLPECSPESATPCFDSSSGLIWSSKDMGTWQNAVEYCGNLSEGNFGDWRLPNINELRWLIQNCDNSSAGGTCRVSDPDCLSLDTCFETSECRCDADASGIYSKFGDSGFESWFWSSSETSDDSESVWTIGFAGAELNNNDKTASLYFRCVRNR